VALGACVYERHLVLNDDVDAVDRLVSSTPSEFGAIVRAMAQTRLALGDGRKVPQATERPNIASSRRGLYAKRPLQAGTRVEEGDLVALRPASDYSPADLSALLGSTLHCDVPAGTPIRADHVVAQQRVA
jgi:sialic acid synthase SpsE